MSTRWKEWCVLTRWMEWCVLTRWKECWVNQVKGMMCVNQVKGIMAVSQVKGTLVGCKGRGDNHPQSKVNYFKKKKKCAQGNVSMLTSLPLPVSHIHTLSLLTLSPTPSTLCLCLSLSLSPPPEAVMKQLKHSGSISAYTFHTEGWRPQEFYWQTANMNKRDLSLDFKSGRVEEFMRALGFSDPTGWNNKHDKQICTYGRDDVIRPHSDVLNSGSSVVVHVFLKQPHRVCLKSALHSNGCKSYEIRHRFRCCSLFSYFRL